MPPLLFVLLGCCVVLALDGAGSLAAVRFGFDYRRLAVVSLVIYAATGFLAASAADRVLLFGSLGGAATAAVDVTLGWRISHALGAGTTNPSERVEIGTATVVTLVGAVIGTIAGLFA